MIYEVRINNKDKLFPVYSTPDRVVFEEPITMDEQVMEWLFACHIFDAREVVWEPQPQAPASSLRGPTRP